MTPLSASLRGIRVEFSGVRAVDDVDLDITAGALTAIVGPNGAGKSTLLEVLAGARRPTAGEVDVHGSTRAFVPQRAAVSDRLPLTVREMVAVGTWGRPAPRPRTSAAKREAVDAAMARLDITPLARHPFASLSGGQRQRALLAQGLASGADLLLLDEPTTGLDTHSGSLIRAAIAEETRRGTSVVCVSHDEALIACATHIVRLEAGRVRSAPAPAR
ncbi:zinc ABC transporter ATP-binding protein AztA [Microbacterium sp. NPDC086615]|uniref:zinc ABC transporter ATP-binding protein AztA n=1 Tax=Microbacterium sp. NPDC086615 TaxID=3154865 RepID=UPI00343308A9